MADLKTKYMLTLNEAEALAMKKLLGNMNDSQFSDVGIKGDDRQLVRNIYDLLPYEDED